MAFLTVAYVIIAIVVSIQLGKSAVNYAVYKKQRDEIQSEINNLNVTKKQLDLEIINLRQDLDEIQVSYNNIQKVYQGLTEKKEQIKLQIAEIENEFLEIKNDIAAGTKAKLREREIAEKRNFYKLSVSLQELEDIHTLEQVKTMLKRPVVKTSCCYK